MPDLSTTERRGVFVSTGGAFYVRAGRHGPGNLNRFQTFEEARAFIDEIRPELPPLDPPNPSGRCKCGCGAETPRARRTRREWGVVKGEHVNFITGHAGACRPIADLYAHHDLKDRGYTSPCWLWRGSVQPNGYGYHDGQGAHRIYYAHYKGPIPEGLVLDHLCMVRRCVNPGHLEPVTQAENLRRARAAARAENRRMVKATADALVTVEAAAESVPGLNAAAVQLRESFAYFRPRNDNEGENHAD